MHTRSGSWLAVGAVAVITVLALFFGNWFVGQQAEARGASDVEVTGAAEAPRAGDAAPSFSAVDLEGAPVVFEAYRGKPVWVLFVATWCAQCRVEAPDVQAAHAERDDVEVLAVYLGEDQRTVGGYAERVGLTFEQVPDPVNEIAAAYGVRAIPAHYFVDADGVVQEVAVGALSHEQINGALDRLVSGSLSSN